MRTKDRRYEGTALLILERPRHVLQQYESATEGLDISVAVPPSILIVASVTGGFSCVWRSVDNQRGRNLDCPVPLLIFLSPGVSPLTRGLPQSPAERLDLVQAPAI